ncbi:hypothetical protein V7182_12580 [Neobacillus drentensis]|uniref:hypothetical protein n=1 Tax=Neobacillus drentensis TaxID=220684 RepID=UPI002FFF9BEC
MKDYHCCATCKHLKIEKKGSGIAYMCGRLGYPTKTNYKFNCWDPKEHIKKLMATRNEK